MPKDITQAGIAPDVDLFLALFHRGEYHAAHDAIEPRWRVTRSHTLQGLIQLAVGWHHACRGNVTGARTLFARALAHLEAADPADDEGLDLAPVRSWLAAAPLALPAARRLPPGETLGLEEIVIGIQSSVISRQ